MTVFLGITYAIILSLMMLGVFLAVYEIGKTVGHRKGVAYAKIQQAHIQSCREKGLAPGARLKYGMPRSGPPHTHPFSETRP